MDDSCQIVIRIQRFQKVRICKVNSGETVGKTMSVIRSG